jgi:hypothetical protein
VGFGIQLTDVLGLHHGHTQPAYISRPWTI